MFGAGTGFGAATTGQFGGGGFAQQQPAPAAGGKGAWNNAALYQLNNGQWALVGKGLVSITTGQAPQLIVALSGAQPFQEPVHPSTPVCIPSFTLAKNNVSTLFFFLFFLSP